MLIYQYVCLSTSIFQGITSKLQKNFLKTSVHDTVPMVVVLSSCGGIAIHYVLPFLWIKLCLQIMARNRWH